MFAIGCARGNSRRNLPEEASEEIALFLYDLTLNTKDAAGKARVVGDLLYGLTHPPEDL